MNLWMYVRELLALLYMHLHMFEEALGIYDDIYSAEQERLYSQCIATAASRPKNVRMDSADAVVYMWKECNLVRRELSQKSAAPLRYLCYLYSARSYLLARLGRLLTEARA